MQPHAGQPVAMIGRPVEEARGIMVMIHGRNAAPKNILDLVPALNHTGFAYVAPAAAGNTWYPYSFMAEIEDNEPGLSSGLHVIDRLVEDLLRRGVPHSKIVLLGFSQGACLTAEFAVRHANRYGGVVVFSGGLIGPPGTSWQFEGSFDGTSVFLGCSDVDAHVPKERVDETERVFERMGADVTKRIYPGMAHTVNDEEIDFARGIMTQVAAG